MGRYPTRWIVVGLIWQGLIVVVAAADALYTGLPAALFAVAWLAAVASPIVPNQATVDRAPNHSAP